MATISKYKTRQRDRMLQNVGTKIPSVFFVNGPNGPTDFFHGVVRSVTANMMLCMTITMKKKWARLTLKSACRNLQEMGEADFEISL